MEYLKNFWTLFKNNRQKITSDSKLKGNKSRQKSFEIFFLNKYSVANRI